MINFFLSKEYYETCAFAEKWLKTDGKTLYAN